MIVRLSDDRVKRMKAEQYIHDTYMITKELVENSIDAGAKNIKVKISQEEIVVSDDGNGLDQESFKLMGDFGCTSKETTTAGVLALTKRAQDSHGFRGQALHSLGLLSTVEITSAIDSGIALRKHLGNPEITKVARERGTTVKVTNAFDNHPVRKKLNRKEYKKHIQRIGEYFESMVFVFNGIIEFQYMEKTKEKHALFNGKKNDLKSFITEKYGSSFQEQTSDFFDLYFFSYTPLYFNHVFYGGRAVKSQAKNIIEKTAAKFIETKPSFILLIKDEADINISVDKSSVILKNKDLFESDLMQAIEKSMTNNKHVESIKFLPERNVPVFKRKKEIFIPSKNFVSPFLPKKPGTEIFVEIEANAKKKEVEQKVKQPKPARKTQKIDLIIEKSDFIKMDVLGQFNKGFILCSLIKNEKRYLILVDQHAADEIKNFEALNNTIKISRQAMINPVVLRLTESQKMLISENHNVVEKNGFKLDEKGEKLLEVPYFKEKCFNEGDFYNLISKFKPDDENDVMCDKYRNIMASKACRTSIMIGKHLTMATMKQVVSNLASLHLPWNCPHGRPTFIVLQEKDILKNL